MKTSGAISSPLRLQYEIFRGNILQLKKTKGVHLLGGTASHRALDESEFRHKINIRVFMYRQFRKQMGMWAVGGCWSTRRGSDRQKKNKQTVVNCSCMNNDVTCASSPAQHHHKNNQTRQPHLIVTASLPLSQLYINYRYTV